MRIRVNGQWFTVPEEWREQTLLDFLREHLDLTGAKNGCGIGRCGACTVLVDGKARFACRTKTSEVQEREVSTIEGLALGAPELHPLQRTFVEKGAIQCGFCTPGMVLRGHAFLMSHRAPTRGDIRKAISPNLCRCTGYQQIVDAIEAAVPYYVGAEQDRKEEKTK